MVSQSDAARASGFSSAIDRIAVESLPCVSIGHPSEEKYRRSVSRLAPPAVAAFEVREICWRLLRPGSCDAWIGVSCGDHSCAVCVPAVQNETHARRHLAQGVVSERLGYLSINPLDIAARDRVEHDHDLQDAILTEQFSRPCACGLDRQIVN